MKFNKDMWRNRLLEALHRGITNKKYIYVYFFIYIHKANKNEERLKIKIILRKGKGVKIQVDSSCSQVLLTETGAAELRVVVAERRRDVSMDDP